MTSWLAVVRGGRGRPRAADGVRRGLSTGALRTAGTLGVLVAGLVVGPYGVVGAAYCFEGPRGPTASGASSGSPAASRTPSAPTGVPTADSESSSSSGSGSSSGPSHPAPSLTAESRPSSSAASPSSSSSASSAGSGRPGKPGRSGGPGRSEGSRPDGRDGQDRRDKQDRHTGASPTSSAHGPGASRPTPADEPSRAGSRAGEGRERPGREKGPLEDEEAAARHEPYGRDGDREGDEEGDGDVGRPPPESSDGADDASAAPLAPADPPVRQPVAHAGDSAEPVLQVLPLGTGLVLVGLGLGLAFVGLRMRRG
ncbi:hypothetical protein ABZZ80_36620 [Streptomyces sp. NPDC006356]